MNFIEKYSKTIVHHPYWVFIISIIICIGCFNVFDMLIVDNPSVDEILPADFEIVSSINKLKDDLGGGEGTAFMVVVELEPDLSSNSVIDIRDPQVVRYTKLLKEQIIKIEDITGASGLGDNVYNLNNGKAANNIDDVKKIVADNPTTFGRIVNDKYSLTIVRIFATEGFDVKKLQTEVQKVIDNTPKPSGVKTLLAGESIAGEVSKELTGPDSSKTTMISLIAIVLILFITFRSPMYTLLPLFTIIFGVIWVYGFMAVTGIRMTNFSSGAIAMIIGIGIDFGIQTIMRFKQELANAKPVLAMEKTMENVLKPMFITTVASVIGFYAMTLGDFIILGELGKIMVLGVIFCFLAAVTVVPALSVIWELHRPKKKINSPFKIFKKIILLVRGKANLK